MSKIKFLFFLLIFLAATYLMASFTIKDVNAAYTWDGAYGDCPNSACLPLELFGTTCSNGPSVGNSGGCGTACDGGSPWTKYELRCKRVSDYSCQYKWTVAGTVCSTADKCTSTSNNPYLNAGACDCSTGGVYKTCCNSNGTVSGGSCIQSAGDTTNPPWEGSCPSGSVTVQCGFGGLPACGVAACQTLATPTFTPAPTPTPRAWMQTVGGDVHVNR